MLRRRNFICTRFSYNSLCFANGIKQFIKRRNFSITSSVTYYKVNLKDEYNPNSIRNIGVIAHIDAGKTTSTECLLYLAGATSTIGNVDDGNTVTDFMEIEREKGITIQSASLSFLWNDHRINLIDTPGHVDFTLEVERSLRVLDGVVTIIDSSAGVEAQTLTVWQQASKFGLPSIFFLNKMDKQGADFRSALNSIEDRLNMKVVPVVIPLMLENKLMGYIHLLKKAFLSAKTDYRRLDKIPKWSHIEKSSRAEEIYFNGIEEVVSKLFEIDNDFAEIFVSAESAQKIPMEKILQTIRKATISRVISPVACGSALKNASTLVPMLDMIVDFLPNPNEAQNWIMSDELFKDVDTCALVFKVGHDHQKGKQTKGSRQLNYVRVYKGKILPGDKLINSTRNLPQPATFKIFTPLSDILEPSQGIVAGNIGVITGLEDIKTGDTLINISNCLAKNVKVGHLILPGIDAPKPVCSCTIEPPTESAFPAFEQALLELSREDPSLHFYTDPSTGQKIINGMGELHIEIVKDRFLRHYGLNVFMGPLQVGYREMPIGSVEHAERLGGSSKNLSTWCSIRLLIEPMNSGVEFSKVQLKYNSGDYVEELSEFATLLERDDWLEAVNNGCQIALFNGPIIGYPICNVNVTLTGFGTSGNKTPSTLISACASLCLVKALKKIEFDLMEPIMNIEVNILADKSGSINLRPLLNELVRRRSTILSALETDLLGRTSTIKARIPLAETPGIAASLRAHSRGLANFHMQFSEYQKVPIEEQITIKKALN